MIIKLTGSSILPYKGLIYQGTVFNFMNFTAFDNFLKGKEELGFNLCFIFSMESSNTISNMIEIRLSLINDNDLQHKLKQEEEIL